MKSRIVLSGGLIHKVDFEEPLEEVKEKINWCRKKNKMFSVVARNGTSYFNPDHIIALEPIYE